MKISIACDHGAFALKERLKARLLEQGHEVTDCGTHSTESCDYPDFGVAAAKLVADGMCHRGVVLCTTGIGMSMAANKVKGIRAAACSDTFSARATREHNNANILCMGERVVGEGLAVMLVEAFLNAEFQGGKHQRRIDQFMALENQE